MNNRDAARKYILVYILYFARPVARHGTRGHPHAPACVPVRVPGYTLLLSPLLLNPRHHCVAGLARSQVWIWSATSEERAGGEVELPMGHAARSGGWSHSRLFHLWWSGRGTKAEVRRGEEWASGGRAGKEWERSGKGVGKEWERRGEE